MSCAAHPSFCSKAPKGPCARRNTPPSIEKHQENPSQTGQETTSGLGWERDGNAAGSCCPGTLLAITVGGDAAASSSGSALGDAAAGAHRRKRERRGRGHCRSGGRRVDQHAHEAALRATPPRPRAIQRQTARRRSRSQRPRRAVRAARNLFLDHFDRAGHDAMQTIRALRRRSIAAPQVEPSRVPWRERVTSRPTVRDQPRSTSRPSSLFPPKRAAPSTTARAGSSALMTTRAEKNLRPNDRAPRCAHPPTDQTRSTEQIAERALARARACDAARRSLTTVTTTSSNLHHLRECELGEVLLENRTRAAAAAAAVAAHGGALGEKRVRRGRRDGLGVESPPNRHRQRPTTVAQR